MKTINKILYILVCLIIIVGIFTWKNNGFNLELQYSTRNQINISNKIGINMNDVEQIASDVFVNKRYFVQEVETFGNAISIVAEEITDEEKKQIIEKFNEKHKTEIKTEDIETITIPFTRVIDIIRPFILPGIVTATIIFVYYLIRFKKLGFITILTKTVINPLLAELLLFSSIAITRIPFGRITTACGMGLYVIVIAILTNKLENEREKTLAEKQETERK